MTCWRSLILGLLVSVAGAAAATLPPHEALRVVIVSDEVNPHGLSDAELTQPGDLSAALLDPGSGLAVESVEEIPTNELQRATALLTLPRTDPAAPDVLVYFSHRIPDDAPDGPARQAAFSSALEAFLRSGGGMVSFHHGAYAWPGKEAVLELIGAQASGAVPWNTTEGQDVIAVAPAHFACATSVAYDGTTRHADAALGVADGDYPFFNNTPDERYPTFTVNATAGDFTVLFASDYAEGGTSHLLGFTHRQPVWEGMVVGYQPGEYQPHSCDPGNPNFQVLANAIVFAANALLPAEPVLRVTKDAAGAAVLAWDGGGPEWGVHRSASPASTGGVASRVARVLARSWTDAAAPAPLTCYSIASR